MAKRKDKPEAVEPLKARETGAAFDLWLERGLHQLFDDIANEPIPDELRRLIDEDRKK